MKVMVLVKATEKSEAGVLPSEQQLTEMGAFNEELVKAGVMLAGEGLHPSARGVRVSFGGGQARVTPGPFAGTQDLVSGFWIWRVKSVEDAVEWIRRSPFRHGTESVEIRRIFEAEDFGANLTPELREQEDRLRAEAARSS
jgi:hypothetical protein